MHKITLLSIAALASLVGAAIAQTPAPEPAWRASALALVPAGYVGGDAYRTDEAAMTGNLAEHCIKKVEVVEYPELGMEAIWRIEVEDFPAFIIIDDKGNDFFKELNLG